MRLYFVDPGTDISTVTRIEVAACVYDAVSLQLDLFKSKAFEYNNSITTCS